MAPPQVVIDLVERFERNAEAYGSAHYNEAQVRTEFVDPFFEALGWDIPNRQGTAEAYKDVVREISIKVGADTKAPDYCFRIGGTPKFFLEAKKPAVNIKQDQAAAFQLRRYAWSRKLPLSLLTSFREFAVYDCRVGPPSQSDKASAARTLYYTYRDYLEQWDEIANRFSKEAVLKGFFDKYIESAKLKRGTAQFDAAFLREIETWRKDLASNIALRNPDLTPRELNFAVQRTIDRIVFLRICEDRGIEPYGQLRELQKKGNIYQQLCVIFRRADDKYNSGLFQFEPERDRSEAPDTLTLRLRIDDDRLVRILKRLYYPDSPYEFSVVPADILGQVYEQFLGKVIRLTAGHQAKIEDKPEVKNAGGIFYTPTYIVDYIVQNTVGKMIEGKTPRQVSKLRILDPACGSGSFLIGAFQDLINWHRDFYLRDGLAQHTKELYQGPGGEWRLTITEKKRILLNNIYGVDVDSQAVEVTKLSLLLKVLEGESDQTLNTNLRLFHERALPDLGQNIKCGNSLIAPDFYQGKQLSFLDDEERYRVNAFDWTSGFPEVMRSGGFDVVMGNPPYVDIKALPADDVDYIFLKYPCANNRINLFAAFIEQALRVVRQKAFRFSMITPTALLTQESYSDLRKLVTDRFDICTVARLPNESFGASAGT
jgi:N-6 DNA Methylase/Type I restriction enzyme R protein N terminus (HSDR_N)/Eco57I restriction-modification methylase